MKFVKKHWLALIALLIVAFTGYYIYSEAESVSGGISSLVKSIKNFFSNLFGGGGGDIPGALQPTNNPDGTVTYASTDTSQPSLTFTTPQAFGGGTPPLPFANYTSPVLGGSSDPKSY